MGIQRSKYLVIEGNMDTLYRQFNVQSYSEMFEKFLNRNNTEE